MRINSVFVLKISSLTIFCERRIPMTLRNCLCFCFCAVCVIGVSIVVVYAILDMLPSGYSYSCDPKLYAPSVEKLDGEHGNFRLEVDGDTVCVFVKTHESRASIKALCNALDLLGKESDKKVTFKLED